MWLISLFRFSFINLLQTENTDTLCCYNFNNKMKYVRYQNFEVNWSYL